jgi:hypothetical protein
VVVAWYEAYLHVEEEEEEEEEEKTEIPFPRVPGEVVSMDLEVAGSVPQQKMEEGYW